MGATCLRPRWMIRIVAFAAILSYGIVIVSTPKHLQRLLDAAFDISRPEDAMGGPAEYGKGRFRRRGHIHAVEGGTNRTGTSPGVRISFQLHDPDSRPLTNAFNLYVTCPLGKVMGGRKKTVPTGEYRSGELPPALLRVDNEVDLRGVPRTGRVLDFTATISTDLKLLHLGDSVMVQLSQAFDEAAGGLALGSRRKVWEAWRGHDGGTMVAPTFGGGATALWRMTALLSMSRKGRPPANSAGGGWSDKEIEALTGYSYEVEGQPHNATIGSLDVVIYRVMHGWMKSNEITHARLVEAVELCGEILGATTVVLMTIPFTNNVKTIEERRQVKEINGDIRLIARGWHARNDTSVQNVLVMEYGNYYDHLIWSNARYLGYNVSYPLRATQATFESEGENFLLDRLNDGAAWSAAIPMVCHDMESLGTERSKCNRNHLFLDGMHVCPERVAARYAAGAACLIGCAHNEKEGEGDTAKDRLLPEKEMRACEKSCNEQFMSVMPVEDSWINATLASFPGLG
ncbi:hypothetical protein ACHAXT_010585 [Thalassiosira profunda]